MFRANDHCDDRNWNTPRPSCTCGAGDSAPASTHFSKRFGWGVMTRNYKDIPAGEVIDFSRDCALYTWHKGCHGATPAGGANKVYLAVCELLHDGRECRAEFRVCENHGGVPEAERRGAAHRATEHTLAERMNGGAAPSMTGEVT